MIEIRKFSLGILSIVTILIVAFRAWNQDLTIDEANTYHAYIAPLRLSIKSSFWTGNSNNHLLSTLLINISTAFFGVSPFTLRLPAVLFSAIYSVSAALLVAQLIDKTKIWMRICLYILLVLNPFIMDYLVAARGYAPALACEMAILFLLYKDLWDSISGSASNARRTTLSMLAALGIASNYSFLFTLFAILFSYFIFIITRRYVAQNFTWRYFLTAAIHLFGPLVMILALLCGDNVMTIQSEDMRSAWGTDSLLTMFSSFSEMIFILPNPFLTPPHLRPLLVTISIIAPWLVLVLILLSIGFIFKRQFAGNIVLDYLGCRTVNDIFICILLGALFLSLTVNIGLSILLGVRFPLTRTGIHLVPLLILVFAAPLYLMESYNSRISIIFYQLFVLSVTLVAVLFGFSQHFSYFQEWKWNANVCEATNTALYYAEMLNTKDVRVTWEIQAAGNFYGEYLGYGDQILSVAPESPLNGNITAIDNKAIVYVLSKRMWRAMDLTGLTPVYESRLDGTMVAVRNAPTVIPLPTSVHWRINMHNKCHNHHWFEDMDFYPGPKWYY